MDKDLYRRLAIKTLFIVVALGAIGALSYWYVSPSSLPSLEFLPGNDSVAPSGSDEDDQPIATPSQSPGGATASPSQATPSTPPPPPPAPKLTSAGIISDTNTQRMANGGLPPLSRNVTLDAVATARMADMFQKQYFEHVAPDGGSVETVAETFNYEHLTLGENIALGGFSSDADVVTAWMESPGHRANILSTRFTQIGAAASQGMFEGEKVWIAVQIFGKPTTACPSVSESLKAAIDIGKAQLSQMETQLEAWNEEIDAMEPKYGSAYNQEVNGYNALVQQYNTLLEQTRAQTNQYNSQIAAFNACAQAD